MGEAVMSGEKLVGIEKEESGTESRGGELKGLMRWEKFLPKMVLRVLLVEADDSTRQIIAALLRKCSYKVAAVPDGLKAWEILKGRPGGFDLILTEVDLPSISGYALLTLIMEHEICKSIPVIMMSSHDSINTVYKCMLGGAVDYLVKPLRKNELRNLWQHVWRRQAQAAAGINGPQDESDAQQKVEATAENNAASNRSGGDAACIQRNKELIEKGSDAQSSCTKPNMEPESCLVDNVHEFSPLKCGEAYSNGIKTQEFHLDSTLISRDGHAKGLTMAIRKNVDTSTTNAKDGDGPEHFQSTSINGEAHDKHCVQINSSKEAIDLIGAFHNPPNCSLKSSIVNCTGEFDYSPQLDLSLRSSNCEKELTEERHTLMHSNASAFKRYTNRQLQASPAIIINFSDQQREQQTNCEKVVPHMATGCNSESSIPSMQRCIVSPTTAQSKEPELATSPTQQQHSLPIPVKGVRLNELRMAYGSVLPPMIRTQSGPPSMPGSFVLLEPNFQTDAFYQSNVQENCSEQPNGNSTSNQIVYTHEHRSEHYGRHGQNGNSTSNQVVYTQERKSEHAEERGFNYPTNDQSTSSSFCNGNASHLNGIGYGSNCGSSSNVEDKNEDFTNSGYSHRSIRREAALNKFRLKRKERCFEKKVRYESRKKLAEQRPRVKGQFVRQLQSDSLATEKDCNEYNH